MVGLIQLICLATCEWPSLRDRQQRPDSPDQNSATLPETPADPDVGPKGREDQAKEIDTDPRVVELSPDRVRGESSPRHSRPLSMTFCSHRPSEANDVITAVSHEEPLVRWEWRFACEEEGGRFLLRLQSVLMQTRPHPGGPWRCACPDAIPEPPKTALKGLLARFRSARLDREQFDTFRRLFKLGGRPDVTTGSEVDRQEKDDEFVPGERHQDCNSLGRSRRHWLTGPSQDHLRARSLTPDQAAVLWYRLGLELIVLKPPRRFAYAYDLGRRMGAMRVRRQPPRRR